MATPDAGSLHALALACRQGADRLVLLRLRLARGFAEATTETREDGQATGDLTALQEDWTDRAYGTLGRLATQLRLRSRELDAAAEEAERAHGVRMGGYRGAGYLGSGDGAMSHLREVTEALGGMAAARGRPGGMRRPALPGAGASHALGAAAPTPSPVDDG